MNKRGSIFRLLPEPWWSCIIGLVICAVMVGLVIMYRPASPCCGMVIVVDTREQRPFTFACITPPPLVEVATLASGDYSVKGLEGQVAIERKSLVDAFGTFGQGRERFERELDRLSRLRFGAVVLEADFDTIIFRPPARSRLKPKTVIRSMAAWAIRHGVHFYWMPNRAAAEKWTWILLDRFYQDITVGKIK